LFEEFLLCILFFACFRRHSTFLQAAAAGAVKALPVAAATLANQIAFVSMLSFVNSMLAWIAARGGISDFSFKVSQFSGTVNSVLGDRSGDQK
jgi:nucleoside permease NupC